MDNGDMWLQEKVGHGNTIFISVCDMFNNVGILIKFMPNIPTLLECHLPMHVYTIMSIKLSYYIIMKCITLGTAAGNFDNRAVDTIVSQNDHELTNSIYESQLNSFHSTKGIIFVYQSFHDRMQCNNDTIMVVCVCMCASIGCMKSHHDWHLLLILYV